jgi:hypothetical protein
MHEQSRAPVDRKLERAIILQLLSEEVGQRCSRARLAAVLGTEREALEDALMGLCAAGVVGLAGAEVWASAPARRIDELGLIGI